MQNLTADDVREGWGDELRLERARQRLSQAKVAEKAGLRAATVCRAEKGRGSLDTFLAIGASLGLDLLGES